MIAVTLGFDRVLVMMGNASCSIRMCPCVRTSMLHVLRGTL